MRTPKGHKAKLVKLAGRRYRLETKQAEAFLEKEGPGNSSVRLEHTNGTIIGTYLNWNEAMLEAMNALDRLEGEKCDTT